MSRQKRITDIPGDRFSVSVEVFPPRNGTSPQVILDKLKALRRLTLDFVSVTKGACGSMRGGTVPIGYMNAERYGMTPLVHFRSRDLTKRETENLLVRQIAEMNRGRYLPIPGDRKSYREGEPSNFCIARK